MRRRHFVRGLAYVGLLAGLAPRSRGDGMAKPAANGFPVVSGPVSGGKRGWPFASYLGDIKQIQCVEEEYFISGAATRYRPKGEMKGDGKWSVEPDGTAPYVTRMLVRRPRDPAKFNGTVLVEWNNVTTGRDLLSVGNTNDPLPDGFAYVGVSVQYVSVNGFATNPQGLKVWDPERYASLSIPSEALCYDIFSQSGRAVGPSRPRRGVDPMAGLNVRKLIAVGGSQSAARLLAYINAIQPRDRVFDAIVPTIGFGSAGGFDDAYYDPTKDPNAASLFRVQTRVRDDLNVPVMIVNSETEVESCYPVRQPDSDRFRYWEVAGASHAPKRGFELNKALAERDDVGGIPFDVGHPSEVDWAPAANAAYVHVHRWLNGGPPPPIQPKIEIKDGTPPQIMRDSIGNAVGGVRLPEVEVPVARYSGRSGNPGLGALVGLTEPLPAEELQRRYPTHADYVMRVTAAAKAAEHAGVILPRHVSEYITAAEARSF